MKHVVYERVGKGTNPLPRGACEAEFARLKAIAIRTGLDEVPERETIEVRVVEPTTVTPNPAPIAQSRRVAQALQSVERLKALRMSRETMTEAEAAEAMLITKGWAEGLRKRNKWSLVQPHGPRCPALYLIDSVIETARQRVDELIAQEKRKRA